MYIDWANKIELWNYKLRAFWRHKQAHFKSFATIAYALVTFSVLINSRFLCKEAACKQMALGGFNWLSHFLLWFSFKDLKGFISVHRQLKMFYIWCFRQILLIFFTCFKKIILQRWSFHFLKSSLVSILIPKICISFNRQTENITKTDWCGTL